MADQSDPPDDVYDLSTTESTVPTGWQTAAIYTLELPARCPYCREVLRTLRVLRLARTQVSFTSPLPRAGRAIVCPLCERILSAELAGII